MGGGRLFDMGASTVKYGTYNTYTVHVIYMSYIFCTQMQYLKNLVSSCQLLRLVGDAAGRNVRDEDSCVSLSPDDVEP